MEYSVVIVLVNVDIIQVKDHLKIRVKMIVTT